MFTLFSDGIVPTLGSSVLLYHLQLADMSESLLSFRVFLPGEY